MSERAHIPTDIKSLAFEHIVIIAYFVNFTKLTYKSILWVPVNKYTFAEIAEYELQQGNLFLIHFLFRGFWKCFHPVAHHNPETGGGILLPQNSGHLGLDLRGILQDT